MSYYDGDKELTHEQVDKVQQTAMEKNRTEELRLEPNDSFPAVFDSTFGGFS